MVYIREIRFLKHPIYILPQALLRCQANVPAQAPFGRLTNRAQNATIFWDKLKLGGQDLEQNGRHHPRAAREIRHDGKAAGEEDRLRGELY